jgi:hypothetical protein
VIAGTVVATKFAGVVLDEFAFDDDFDDIAPAIITTAVTSTIKPTMNHAVVRLELDELFAIGLLYYIARERNIGKKSIKKPLHDILCGGGYFYNCSQGFGANAGI